MKQLIIRADDIGYSEAVNYGIEKSVKEGLIGSAGLMPNMPFAEHGLKLLEGTGIAIGQHTNMCLEKPCSDPKDIPSLVDENGYLKSEIKVADMYKNGFYVKQDYDMYCRIIEESYKVVRHTNRLDDPFPEICTRLARIRKKQNRYEEAISLYHDAKFFLQQRIRYTHFFGDLNIMKWLIEDLDTMIPFDSLEFDFYDLYYLLKQPVTVRFRYNGNMYTIETEEGTAIHFFDQWYRNVDDFMYKAYIEDDKLHGLYGQMYGFEVMK